MTSSQERPVIANARIFWSHGLPWLGALAGAALLAWVLRNFDWSRFVEALSAAHWWLFVVLPAANLVQVLLRAEKWRHMLHPLATVGRLRLFAAIMGGHFADMIAPLRFGLLVRAWLIARLEDMRTGSLLATVAMDRTIDGFVFTGFAAVALMWWRFPGQAAGVRDGLFIGAGVSVAALIAVAAIFLALRRGALRRLSAAFPALTLPFLPDRWRGAVGRFADAFVDGIVWPAEYWRVAMVIGTSVLIKLVAVGYFVWAGLAFEVVLHPADYLFLMVFLGFLLFVSGMLKIVGGFTAGAVFALELLGIEVETGLAMTLIVQISSHITVAVAGVVALWAQGVSVGALWKARHGGIDAT